MKKVFLFFLLTAMLSSSLHAQLALVKMVGKNADKSKIGFGAFGFYDFPLNDIGNNSIRLEILDAAYFPPKNTDTDASKVYISIKLGYKHIFSETKTGFYLEPQAGYCRVIFVEENEPEATFGDGIALALEGGYSLEVGQNSNTFNFGLKYETDRAGSIHTISAIGLRISYSFNLFRRRG